MLLTTILILVRQVHQNSHLNIQEVLKKKMQMEHWNLDLEAQQDHLLQRQALKIQEHGRTGRKLQLIQPALPECRTYT